MFRWGGGCSGGGGGGLVFRRWGCLGGGFSGRGFSGRDGSIGANVRGIEGEQRGKR